MFTSENDHLLLAFLIPVPRKKMAKLGIVLGDYNNNREHVDAGQIMRDVAEVNLFFSFTIHINALRFTVITSNI